MNLNRKLSLQSTLHTIKRKQDFLNQVYLGFIAFLIFNIENHWYEANFLLIELKHSYIDFYQDLK